jgi:hypothetical protein
MKHIDIKNYFIYILLIFSLFISNKYIIFVISFLIVYYLIRIYWIFYKINLNKNIKEKHVGIVYIKYHYYTIENVIYLFNFCFRKRLEKLIKSNNIKYNNYIVETEEDFKNILNNKDIEVLIINAHSGPNFFQMKNSKSHYKSYENYKTNIKYVIDLSCGFKDEKKFYEYLGVKGFGFEKATCFLNLNEYLKTDEFKRVLNEYF